MNKKELINSLKDQKFPLHILKAFDRVDRSKFVPIEFKKKSYQDIPLPIGHNQTISQPYTIAFMLMLSGIKDEQNILEVGSGSGYVLALLSNLSPNGKIVGFEIIKELAENSKKQLKNYKNVEVIEGNALRYLSDGKEFDRIIVSAASQDIPQKLLKKLKFGGIMVVPVKNSLIVIEKNIGENKLIEYPGFSFVPLIE